MVAVRYDREGLALARADAGEGEPLGWSPRLPEILECRRYYKQSLGAVAGAYVNPRVMRDSDNT